MATYMDLYKAGLSDGGTSLMSLYTSKGLQTLLLYKLEGIYQVSVWCWWEKRKLEGPPLEKNMFLTWTCGEDLKLKLRTK